jgi:hypothetical protein
MPPHPEQNLFQNQLSTGGEITVSLCDVIGRTPGGAKQTDEFLDKIAGSGEMKIQEAGV